MSRPAFFKDTSDICLPGNDLTFFKVDIFLFKSLASCLGLIDAATVGFDFSKVVVRLIGRDCLSGAEFFKRLVSIFL